jgi:hypothetical protein
LFIFFGWNVPRFWVLVDFVMALAGSFTDKAGAFVLQVDQRGIVVLPVPATRPATRHQLSAQGQRGPRGQTRIDDVDTAGLGPN